MSARDPADPPQAPEPGPSAPVLSLESRKAQRRREKADALSRDPAEAEAHLLRVNAAVTAELERRARDGIPMPPEMTRPSIMPNARPDQAPGAPGEGGRVGDPAPEVKPQRPCNPGKRNAAAVPGRKPAATARPRLRHWVVVASFVALVLVPTALAAWYLWTQAAPRYASHAGFSVRAEDTPSAMDLLGGVTAITGGGSSSKDTDILYEFIQSQEIVQLVDARLDLRALWSRGDPAKDPVFSYHPPGTVEDLHAYWQRMVSVYNDGSTGLLDLEVQAFSPQDAQTIAQAIYDESGILVNRLSDIAQTDATRYAEEDLEVAVERLKTAREAMTRFRNETQIVDPAVSMQGQMGLLSSLEEQLAQTLIDLDILRQTAPDDDPRIEQAERRVGVIQARMADERAKLGLGQNPGAAGDADGEGANAQGLGASGGEAFADLMGEYERLLVDQEFANQAYVAALASYDSALAESRRQSRYLAAHVQPTLAESAAYPQRVLLTVLTLTFALLAWTILTLAAYALRDRR